MDSSTGWTRSVPAQGPGCYGVVMTSPATMRLVGLLAIVGMVEGCASRPRPVARYDTGYMDAQRQTLTLYPDGSFVASDPWCRRRGTWRRDADRLVLGHQPDGTGTSQVEIWVEGGAQLRLEGAGRTVVMMARPCR